MGIWSWVADSFCEETSPDTAARYFPFFFTFAFSMNAILVDQDIHKPVQKYDY